MVIVRLIYASKIKTGYGPNDVLKIVEVSEQNNQKSGITGALCFGPRYFLQCLEGPRDAVNKLYNTIVVDERHTDVELLYYADVDERVFGDWSMGYVLAEKKINEIVFRFGGTKSFNPYTFSAKQSVGFLKAAVQHHQQTLDSKVPNR